MEETKQCRDDGTPLLIRSTKPDPKRLTKRYYYTAYYYCPTCHKIYHDNKFKVENMLMASPSLFSLSDSEVGTYDVEIWTDGACVFNGTPKARAAWAFVSGEYEANGLIPGPKQTNNVAEATAILKALEWAAEKGCQRVKLHSDSQISLNNMKKEQHMVKENRDIFDRIFQVIREHKLFVTWVKVPGHADDVNNNRADRLANGLVGIK